MSSISLSNLHFCTCLNNYTTNSKPPLPLQIKLSVASHRDRQDEPPRETTRVKGTRYVRTYAHATDSRSSEAVDLGAIFNFSGKKPNYLGVQKNPPGLALCPATNNCVSTSENISDLIHYAPPWNYNPEEGRGSERPVSREEAMVELIEVVESTTPDNFIPEITEQRDDYVRVEYESPILGFVDDVEFWFPPGDKTIVQYRSASRLGSFDFDINRKRIKALTSEDGSGEEGMGIRKQSLIQLYIFFSVLSKIQSHRPDNYIGIL